LGGGERREERKRKVRSGKEGGNYLNKRMGKRPENTSVSLGEDFAFGNPIFHWRQ